MSDSEQVTVRIPTILRSYTGGESVVGVVISPESTVAELIESLEVTYPGIRARVIDETGALRRFVNIYVDDDDVRFDQGVATELRSGSTVSIIPAVAGG